MVNVSVEEIMSEHLIKVKEEVSVGNVAHLLLRNRINGILVVKNSGENQLVGIFTTTDLLRLMNEAFAKKNKRVQALDKLSQTPVGKVASKNIISISKETTVIEALALMIKKNIHTIPVYEKGKVVGVIGKHDILNIVLN